MKFSLFLVNILFLFPQVQETGLEAVETTETHEVSNSVTKNADGEKMSEITETVTTTTTITTVSSTTIKTVTTPSENSNLSLDDDEEPLAKKPKLNDQVDQNSKEDDDDDDQESSKSSDESIVVNTSSDLAEAIKSTSDGKSKVISLQSLLPAARQGLLKSVDKNCGSDDKQDGQTKTVLLVNREGDKVTLQVQRQPVKEDETTTKTNQSQGIYKAVPGSGIVN